MRNNMIELLTTFSISQIVLFVVIILLAIKEGIGLLDFFYERIRRHYDAGYRKNNEMGKILEKIESHEARSANRAKDYAKLADQVEGLKKQLEEDSARQETRIDLLTRSDKNSIKSFIVKEYHFFVEKQKWIDDFSMDSIEQKFADYEEMEGNSYVHSLVEELRRLPKCPPRED